MQAEANADVNVLPNMNAVLINFQSQVFYYRVTQGICYSVGKITINLFKTPTVIDQDIFVCDTNNDNSETVTLSNLTSQLIGLDPTFTVLYYQNLPNATTGTNAINAITVATIPGFYDIYIRTINPLNLLCFSISKITIKLLPKLVLAPIATFCIPDPDFNNQQVYPDLNAIPITVTTGPLNPTLTYYTSALDAQNGNNPISNLNYNVVINPPATFTTLYVRADAPGFCPTFQSVQITFCIADGTDGGGPGGNGGFGGIGICINSGDPIPTINLNTVFDNVVAPLSLTPIGFYTTLLGAQTQNTAVQLTAAETLNYNPLDPAPALFIEIWVRFVDANGIVGIRKIIIPYKVKSINPNQEFTVCDVYNNGTETVQLAPYIAIIQAANPGQTVTCHITSNFSTPAITQVNVISPSTIVYVKVDSFGCVSTYDLKFVLTPFDIKPVQLKEVCDINADGTEPYNLNALIPNLILGYTTPILTFHTTLNGAFDEINLIPNSTTNYPVTATTQVWVRIEDEPNCPSIIRLDFGFFNSVDVNVIGIKEFCDDDGDGKVTFDLNPIVTAIVIPIPGLTITQKLYYDLVSAQTNNPVGEIQLINWSTFIFDNTVVTNGFIYLYLKNELTGCERIVPIAIQLNSFPVTTNPTVTLCDFENNGTELIPLMSVFNSQITSSYLLYTFQYFLTNADAVAGTPQIPGNYTVTNNQIVYVKISSGTAADCSFITPINIILKPSPVVTNLNPIICDNLGDSSEIINLNAYQSQLVTNPANYTFSYYTFPNDALVPINAISNNYTATFNAVTNLSGTVYVRVQDLVGGCFSVATIIFQRKPLIDAYDTIGYACDISTGNQLEGLFDLTSFVPRVAGNGMIINPTNFTISYHNSLANATSGTLPIVNPNAFPVFALQTSYVYVRFLDVVTGCFTVKRLELQIYDLPKFVNKTLDICDDNLDGIYSVNLTNLNGLVVLIPAPFTFKYYLVESDALANNGNFITNFTNYVVNVVSFPLRIYVQGTNVNGCIKVKYVELQNKSQVPLLVNTKELLICDDNNDGIVTFNLTDAQLSFTTQLGVTFTYFRTLADMQNNTNAIVSPNSYTNSATNPIVVYVRLSSPATNCDSYGIINLNAFYRIYNFSAPITLCDNNADGSETINLVQTTFGIIAPITNANVSLEFYFSVADALAGNGLIPNPTTYLFTNFSTSIYVKITDNVTLCSSIERLNFVHPNPILINNSEASLCDSDRNGSETFNLTNYFGQMTILPNTPSNYTITSYLTENNANAGLVSTQISNTNFAVNQPQQTVYIRFVDSNGCFSVKPLLLKVILLPNPLSAIPLQLCDDNPNPTAVLVENFNITTNATAIQNGNTNTILTYHITENDAELGQNAITSNLTNYQSPTATIYIRVTTNPVSSVVSCAVIVPQKLIVNALPLAGIMTNLYSCKNAGSTNATFDLNTKNVEVLTGQNPSQFSVTYHPLPTDAKSGANPLPLVYNSGSQTIWASVRNNNTGCRNTSPLNLVAETTTTATQPSANTTFICDNDLDNDGFTTFNLFSLNSTILGSQNSNYQVTYFANASDFANNIPIVDADLPNYTNVSNPQTIIANVVNTASQVIQKCSANIAIVLKVQKLPESNPNDGFVCYDQQTGNLLSTFTINSGLSATTHTFQWFQGTSSTPISGQNSSSLVVSTSGNYSVIATGIAYPNCASVLQTASIIKSEPAIAKARVEYSFESNIKIIVSATGIGNYTYQLDKEPIQNTNIFENCTPGKHIVTVYDTIGCQNYTLEAIVLDYDKYFTPNNDGYNDVWNIRGIKDQPKAIVYLFDRYGKLLKQIAPDEDGWNGKFNGEMLPADDYWFTVNYLENGQDKVFKSHFAMKR